MRWIWMRALALMVFALGIAGCPSQSRPDCDSDADCLAGQACVQQVCQDVECKLNSDCTAGEQCLEHACVPIDGCSSDGQCEIGQICVDAACTAGCRVDADCPAELVCIPELGAHGLCAECRQDADCDAGQSCTGNQCRAPCTTSQDCPDGVCDPASGTCVQCLQDAHCTSPEICKDNLCQPGCRSDADCPAGRICDPSSGACIEAECAETDDCQLGQLCIDGACLAGCESSRDCPQDQDCLPDEGAHGVCAECTTDADCSAGQRCANFHCTENCASDADCPAGYCLPEVQVCVTCLDDAHCDPGFICLSGDCLEGCRLDGDCPAGQICGQGLMCRPGCRSDAGCPAGQICDDGACRVGCRADGDCQNGTCDPGTWQCVGFGCTTKDDCQLGQVCIDHQCVAGCEESRDCPDALVCAVQLGPNGTCVDCLTDGDCLDPDFPTCLDHACEPECWEDGDCPADQVCVQLHCVDLPDECVMSIEPQASVDFGAIPIGAAFTVPFSLSNLGGRECGVSEIEVRSGIFPATDFMLGFAPALPLVLGPQQTAQVEVTFAPGSEQDQWATLWVTTDDPDFMVGADNLFTCGFYGVQPGQACIPLSGRGVLLDVQPVPASVDFDRAAQGCGTLPKTVRFYNLGEPVSVTAIGLEQEFDPDFSIGAAPVTPFDVATDFQVEVAFHPQTTGPHANALLIQFGQANLPPLRVPLAGIGVQGDQVVDQFDLPDEVRVDVLWVVDNSGSMGWVQNELASNFSSFIDLAILLGVHFHVGVIATEVNDPESGVGDPPRDVLPGVLVQAPGRPRIITPDTVDPEAAFADNVQVGTCCSDEQEAGLQASWMALSPPLLHDPEANGGFLREDAKLYVIYVSDEEDQSAGPVAFFVDYFLTLKGSAELATLSAICGDSPDGCGGNQVLAEAGDRYVAAMEQTEGTFQSICQDDWSGLMEAIGDHAFAPVRQYVLSRPAAQGTISVTLDGSMVPEASAPYAPDGWTWVPGANAIWFGDYHLPGVGSNIQVDYTALCL